MNETADTRGDAFVSLLSGSQLVPARYVYAIIPDRSMHDPYPRVFLGMTFPCGGSDTERGSQSSCPVLDRFLGRPVQILPGL